MKVSKLLSLSIHHKEKCKLGEDVHETGFLKIIYSDKRKSTLDRTDGWALL